MKKIFVLTFIFLFPAMTFAGSTVITNTVLNSVSTGGNTTGSYTNSAVTKGESRSEVYIHTEINGQVVEDRREVRNDDSPIVIESRHETSSGSVNIAVTATTGSTTPGGMSTSTPIDFRKNVVVPRPGIQENNKEVRKLPEKVLIATTSTSTTATTSNEEVKIKKSGIGSSIRNIFNNFFKYATSIFKR